ncbi:MarR family winged helix-turn-helix transcriptional regulator [Streptosporangium amethystogenes subsp. fukuiense]|uniref:MarR family winged helix-turn-helix transcriptional regulator n=2 Tax=Streptosporangiaceae TaxID=2004 RepID=A0ABW2SXG1_9ACTN
MDTTAQTVTETAIPSGHPCTAAGPASEPMDVATALIQLTGLVQGIYARVSERHDLTPVQAKLLCVLLEGPRGMADLAQIFGVERAALTGLMDRAEKRGLARRDPVPGDRRALQATLTDTGREAAAAFHAEITGQLAQLTADLDLADGEHLRATMTGIIQQHRAAFGAGPADCR